MAELPLSGKRGQGRVALCDAADLPLLSLHRWHLSQDGYPRTYLRKPGVRSTTICMHQLLRTEQGECYRDHLDGNPLDNRRANLRPASRRENSRNRRVHRNNKTGLKGVSPFKGKYRATIHLDRKQISLGTFSHPLLAAIAYNAAATALYGPFAALNPLPTDLLGQLACPVEVRHAAD